MKKLIIALISSSFVAMAALSNPNCVNAEASPSLTTDCKSAYLCDYNSGECIYKENENLRIPIASVCKVMTLNLCFDAIEQGVFDLDSTYTVSERASSMGGSQIFLEKGLSYPISQLVKSIIVCSANDSCVAIAEAVSGSEEQFVAQMNSRAAEYGCTNTLFSNCTGLPRDAQYSCAKDVAIMYTELLRHEDYFKFSKIWLEDFEHPNGRTTSMTNTNKLIKRYSYCDGGKTGFTNEAGFCLASTAKRDNVRLVSVVLGASSSDIRFKCATNMFNYGFSNYKNSIVLDSNVNLNETIEVNGGKKEYISIRPKRTCLIFTKKDEKPNITFKFVPDKLYAPIDRGNEVGKIEVYRDGILYDTVEVVAAEPVEKANYFDNVKRISGDWTI